MFTTRVEISPLQRDSEGKLRGGFSTVMGGGEICRTENKGCKNALCGNDYCLNALCANDGCSNGDCVNVQCTNNPIVVETPSTTTTVRPLYKM